jgi:hypothetical protein
VLERALVLVDTLAIAPLENQPASMTMSHVRSSMPIGTCCLQLNKLFKLIINRVKWLIIYLIYIVTFHIGSMVPSKSIPP